MSDTSFFKTDYKKELRELDAFFAEHDHDIATVDELFRAPTSDATHACLIPFRCEYFGLTGKKTRSGP